jgi:predicted PurR-regulated permease PerM
VIDDFGRLLSEIPRLLTKVREFLARDYPSAAARLPSSPGELIRENIDQLGKYAGGLLGYAQTLADVFVSAFVVFVGTIYTLSSPKPLAQGFIALFRPEMRAKVTEAVQELSAQMLSWALGTFIGMITIFLLVWIALSLLGVEGAFLIALLSGVLEIVPVLGPIASGGIAVLAALAQSPELAIWTFLVFVVIQQIEGQILIPVVMSGRLELHPVSVIFAVLTMGALFGIVGIFLATPAVALIKVVVYKFWIEPITASNGPDKEEIPEHAERIVQHTPQQRPDTGQPGPDETRGEEESNQTS